MFGVSNHRRFFIWAGEEADESIQTALNPVSLSHKPCNGSKSKSRRNAVVVCTGVLAAGVVALTAGLGSDEAEAKCPLATKKSGIVSRDAGPLGPSAFLSEARLQMSLVRAHKAAENHTAQEQDFEAVAAARRAFETCAFWTPKLPNSKMHLSEIRAQLECQKALVDEFGDSDAGLLAGERSFELLQHARRILHRCSDIVGEFQALRQSKMAAASTNAALVSMSVLAGLEGVSAHALNGLVSSEHLLASVQSSMVRKDADENDLDVDNSFDDETYMPSAEVISSVRISLRGCLLRSVREARALSASFSERSAQVHRALVCSPRMLERVEALALREAALEVDPGVNFALGMHHSELAIALQKEEASPTQTSAFFGEQVVGVNAQAIAAKAEELLLLAEQVSTGKNKDERALLRGKRLLQHAHVVFAPSGMQEAVVRRFHEAAFVLAEYGDTQMAASALSDLSQFYMSSGNYASALDVAGQALAIDKSEPLALYLQATLRRSLGELRTEEDVHVARLQLSTAAGQLPGNELETRRAAAYAEIAGWASIAEEDSLAKCFELHDAAFVLICALCRVAYNTGIK